MPAPKSTLYRFRGSIPPQSDKPRAYLAPAPPVDGVATIHLYDPIDSWGGEWGVSAKEFTTALATLGDDVSEIRLHINSPGGEVFEGIAILNALRNHPANVVAVVDGLAASAASFIATGADELVMGLNTQLMIHDAWGIAIGPASDMRDMAQRLDQISDNIASVYAAKSGTDLAGWRSAMLAETWYTADEAVDAGLADRVEGEESTDTQNAFDLSMFTYAGREAAPSPEAARVDEAQGTPNRDAIRHRMNERRQRP